MRRFLGTFGLAALLVFGAAAVRGQEPARPLKEADLVRLIELQVGDEAVIGRLAKGRLDFAADEAALDRLKSAGASDAVIEAVRKAGASRPAPAGVVTFENVRELLDLGVAEAAILGKLEKSPTRFVLDAAQKKELVALGASPRLIGAMEGRREQAKNSEINDFVLILDCSASMSEATADGTPKMDAARKAVADLIARVPNGRRVALVIYGHDKALACKAVKVVRPMAELDASGRAELVAFVQSLEPVGSTPIANSLRTAGEQLDPQVPATMVLVSDGVETCKGDPAATATALAAKFNLTFGVVGFDVKPEERASLEQIATAGKGRYFDARTAAELVKVAEEVAEIEPESEDPDAVTDPIEVWVEKKDGASENPLQSELIVNGRNVGVFSLNARKPLAKFLKRGWNTVEVVTTAETPAASSNGLLFRVGPVEKDAETGEPSMTFPLWQFRNDDGWTLEGDVYRHRLGPDAKEVRLVHQLYYAGLENERKEPKEGDYVLRTMSDWGRVGQLVAGLNWRQPNAPVSATVFVNGTPVSSRLAGERLIRITPLLKAGRNEVKVVTRPVSGALEHDDLTVQVGGPLKYSPAEEKFLFTPVAEAKAMSAWKHDEVTGQVVGKGDPSQAEFVRTLSFVLDEAPPVESR